MFSHYIELYVISIENVVKEAELIAERRQQIMRCDQHDQSFDILYFCVVSICWAAFF